MNDTAITGTAAHERAIPRPALLAAIFIFIFIEYMQSGMTVFAAGQTMGQIGASPEEYSFLTGMYGAVAVLMISQMTVLIQRFGWRDFLVGSTLLSALGAWTCAGATSVAGYGLGRLLMGLGGGVFMSSSRMMVNLIPPSPARMIGILTYGGGLAFGLTLAPLAAGTLVEQGAWMGIFVFLGTLALLGGVLALRWLPRGAATLDVATSRFDLGDGLTLAGAAFLLLYGLQRLSFDWHGDAVHALLPLACGLALALLFVVEHRRRERGFLRLEMLASARLRTGMAIFAVCYAILGIFNTVLPLFVQRTLGIPLEQAGQLQAAGMSASIPVLGVLILIARKRPHATKFFVTGFLSLAAFGWHFSNFDPDVPAWLGVAPWVGLFAAFVILAIATTALHSFTDLQHDNVLFANGQQLKNMLGQFGSAAGAGFGALLLQDRGALHGARLAESIAGAGAGGLLAQQGNLLSALDVFRVLAWIGVAGAVILAMQRRFD
jgi:MFS transporter, DHA2 family, multidrug resistance protein